MPRVLVVGTGGTSNASARARIFCYLPLLRAHGIKPHVTSYVFHKHLRRSGMWGKVWLEMLPLRNVIAFLRSGTIYLHRLNFSTSLVRFARLLGKRIVLDFDDAVYLHPPDSDVYVNSPVHRERADLLNWILSRADAVIVSGEELRRYAEQHAREVHVIPSVVTAVAPNPSASHVPPVIGWVGAPENLRYLKLIEPVLLKLQVEIPELEIWLITRELADPPPRFRHRFIQWSLQAEAEWIPQFTVGSAPLDDDPWCRAKMNYKALVYISHGVPAIVTPGGFPLEVFEEGNSVLAARDAEEWYSALREVIQNPERRNQLANEGMKVVREKFMPKTWVEKLAGVLVRQP